MVAFEPGGGPEGAYHCDRARVFGRTAGAPVPSKRPPGGLEPGFVAILQWLGLCGQPVVDSMTGSLLSVALTWKTGVRLVRCSPKS